MNIVIAYTFDLGNFKVISNFFSLRGFSYLGWQNNFTIETKLCLDNTTCNFLFLNVSTSLNLCSEYKVVVDLFSDCIVIRLDYIHIVA